MTKLWGGRFSKKTDPLVEKFTKSIQYDHKLAECDLVGSIVHVSVLKAGGFLSPKEYAKLNKILVDLYKKARCGKFKWDPACEDIHTNIHNKVQKTAGNLASKLHTARSRNDQVAFATKLYCIVNLPSVIKHIEDLNAALKSLSGKTNIVIPGFTHMQHAQPVLLSDYLNAYAEMFKRDIKKLQGIVSGIEIKMGAGALAGTPISANIYSKMVSTQLKKLLGKKVSNHLKVTTVKNSLDAVSDRDFVIDTINALSMIAMHISRIAEDLIIWSSKEFDFVELDDAFCTGSSLMPQKKNPDSLELMRGYGARLAGNSISILTLMKGLPLSYNRDMQLDKEPLFESFEIVSAELQILSKIIKTLKFNKNAILEYLEDESLYATDLVYYLVKKGIAFEEAHSVIGKLIKYSLNNSIKIKEMEETKLKKFSDKFVKKQILTLFNPEVSIKSKKSIKRN